MQGLAAVGFKLAEKTNDIMSEGLRIMAIEKVREYFKRFGKEKDIIEFEESTATVELAARRLGVEPARIAKTLSFKNGKEAILVVATGDAKVDNAKFKSEFNMKARMLTHEEVLEQTGHAVGGVCPFGLKKDIPVFLDLSLKRFDTVYPACGSDNSAIPLTCDELFEYSSAIKWVDVCKGWQ
jgi:prolyl-tRNA editing enzyme YbaK/EbsC (Cys-tRNA(Pro) deacylase)